MKLRYENLKHTYQSPAGEPRTVLDISEWALAPGEQVLLRGVSGSGKTTLFNITAGLMRPTEGTVWFGEQSLYGLPESQRDRFRARNVGYVFQNHHLITSLSAIENVIMPMAFTQTFSGTQRRARAADLLTQVGLGDHLNYRPEQMSTGQRLRVAIARALANNPTVLLADEPTAALDPDAAVQVMALIRESCEKANAILLVASHDPSVASGFGKIANLHNGKLDVTSNQNDGDNSTASNPQEPQHV